MVDLDITAISGICGSISIACWLVVFSPQIFENFRRNSADGLSVQFIIVWLSGDVCNVLGSAIQGVLPTMLILAVYYMTCDICLLGQCFYYRGFTWRDTPDPVAPVIIEHPPPNETSALLSRKSSSQSLHHSVSASHLSPAVPLISESNKDITTHQMPPLTDNPKTRSIVTRILLNVLAILVVISLGCLGWYLTRPSSRKNPGDDQERENDLYFSPLGQVFGYMCATLYLSSRIPQLLLNYRRKSTEGVSMLFFMFACLGNLTYVLSILFYNTQARDRYWRYIAVNASWLAGSAGTLLLDGVIFTQFWLYRDSSVDEQLVDHAETNEDDGASNGVDQPHARESWGRDQRPLLERGDSGY